MLSKGQSVENKPADSIDTAAEPTKQEKSKGRSIRINVVTAPVAMTVNGVTSFPFGNSGYSETHHGHGDAFVHFRTLSSASIPNVNVSVGPFTITQSKIEEKPKASYSGNTFLTSLASATAIENANNSDVLANRTDNGVTREKNEAKTTNITVIGSVVNLSSNPDSASTIPNNIPRPR